MSIKEYFVVNGSITIALAQTHPLKGDIEHNLSKHLGYISESASHGADIVIFPELSITGYEPDLLASLALSPSSSVVSDLVNAAIKCKIIVIAGIPLANDDEKPYIASLIAFPSGKKVFYRKQYLHESEESFYSAGSENFSFSCNGFTLYHGICADFSNEQHWNDARIASADIYLSSVLISKNGLESDFELLSERAKLNRLNVALVNSVGITGGWNSAGCSGAWNSDGHHVLSATDDECIVLCIISNSGVSGEAINITKS
ncbi:MAG: carbon-nitrogen hydrolase family protein [Plesiomonas sp.]|uniref:carbon-nitrogen hydrolase family protein n=1 Tax=Plesiomonas sp. TaxID=2486279 RepID=UPI003F2E31E7